MSKSRTGVQGPEAVTVYSTGADDACERMLKSDSMYQGGEPSLGFQPGSVSRARQCGTCGTAMNKALTACTNCGAGVVGGVLIKGEGANAPVILEKSYRGLRPARPVEDLYLPQGVILDQE
jgi:hypothetical protein